MRILRLVTALLFASLGGIAPAAAREYSAEPIEATVIDAATRQPVGDALVIARWIGKGDGGMHTPRDLGSVHVLETLTDEKGRFAFPAWGPARYAGGGVLLDDDPLILVYKHGYQVARLSNSQYRVPPSKDFRDHGDRVVSLRDRLVMNDALFARKGCGSPRADLPSFPRARE